MGLEGVIMGPGKKKNKLREVFDSMFDDEDIINQCGGSWDLYDDRDYDENDEDFFDDDLFDYD